MSIPLNGTLVLVGAGKMGGAMLEGWLKSGVDPKKIAVLDPFASSDMKALLAKHKVSAQSGNRQHQECGSCPDRREAADDGRGSSPVVASALQSR